MTTLSRFPPSFENNPWSYGVALFGLTLVSAMALALLTSIFLERRHRAQIDVKLDNHLPSTQALAWLSPLSIYRLILVGFLVTVVMGAVPDVLLLLAWGEASDRTIEFLFLLDRLLDGTLSVPFLVTCFLVLWGGQAVEHRLANSTLSISTSPPWKLIRDKFRMAVVVLVLSVGVTFAKSVA